jgi:hypothetical protein
LRGAYDKNGYLPAFEILLISNAIVSRYENFEASIFGG